MVAVVPSVQARVLPLLAALTVGLALPAGAVAQTLGPQLPGISEKPPPWPGGDDEEPRGATEPRGQGGGGEPGGQKPSGGDGQTGASPGGGDESGGGEPSGKAGSSGEEDASGEDEPSGGRRDPSGSADGGDGPTAGELPRTGSEPLLLGLSGAALALLGTGLRLRTLDADIF